MTIVAVGRAAHGTATLRSDGKILYRPDAGFSGIDTFNYTLSDGHGGKDTATASVQVLPKTVKLAVIGDYGFNSLNEKRVADMVKSWAPDAVFTLGDNVYGAGTPYDTAVGKYYSSFIGNYHGSHGAGSQVNRFFPALGNHDYFDAGLQNYLEFFSNPKSSSGNERYYSVKMGPVDFFVLNSDPNEPNGLTAASKQGQWLKAELAHSTAAFQFVIQPSPPHSSGSTHGPNLTSRWPFENWGADAVLSGDEHNYERFLFDSNHDGRSLPYFVNGLGGSYIYDFESTLQPGSQAHYNGGFGAMLISVNEQKATFEFHSTIGGDTVIDSFTLFVA